VKPRSAPRPPPVQQQDSDSDDDTRSFASHVEETDDTEDETILYPVNTVIPRQAPEPSSLSLYRNLRF
jgi:hypothetical protein